MYKRQSLYQGVSEGSSAGLVISSLDMVLAPGEILVIRAQSQGTGEVMGFLNWVEYYEETKKNVLTCTFFLYYFAKTTNSIASTVK